MFGLTVNNIDENNSTQFRFNTKTQVKHTHTHTHTHLKTICCCSINISEEFIISLANFAKESRSHTKYLIYSNE